jgi:hypothetical protein
MRHRYGYMAGGILLVVGAALRIGYGAGSGGGVDCPYDSTCVSAGLCKYNPLAAPPNCGGAAIVVVNSYTTWTCTTPGPKTVCNTYGSKYICATKQSCELMLPLIGPPNCATGWLANIFGMPVNCS